MTVKELKKQARSSTLGKVRLADLYLSQGKVKKALRLCRKGLRVDPQLGLGYLILGKSLLKLKQMEQACSALQKARELEPDNAQVLIWLGRVFLARENKEGYIESQKRLLEIDPLVPELRGPEERPEEQHTVEVAGEELVDENLPTSKPAEPVESPEESSVPPQKEGGVMVEMAAPQEERPLPIFSREKLAESGPVIEKGEETPPPEPHPHYQGPTATKTLAEIYASQGQYSKAIKIYRRLIELDSYDGNLKVRLDYLIRKMEETEQAGETGNSVDDKITLSTS
ncbi:tetratricopeptide repeat protein [candidate division KSB1 bacterium]|nr:tetratricopeptide repeat protein [candidate division KSB1 bacterium]